VGGVRCPSCNKKYGEYLEGVFVFFCKGCDRTVVLDTTEKAVIK
jgi:transposase-like protein